ncbi:NAD(P)/FAD-dependent oxidoreductase [Psychrobacter sp. WY6]|uniref:NAD(P)/FAD-dependent oxidoreductase n=1 Tax=Psychrobacter sp. WY6 TaxID=2708350 RepID=UPI002022F595
MSGGGRCNFTNYYVEPEHFIGANQHFCKSALIVIPAGNLSVWWQHITSLTMSANTVSYFVMIQRKIF